MIFQSDNVYAVIRNYAPTFIAILLSYILVYCTSYALVFKMLGFRWYLAYIPWYGQAKLFKLFKESPWIVFLPLLPVIGIFYVYERIWLRDCIYKKLRMKYWKLIFILFPIIGNIIAWLIWRSKDADIY